MDLSSLRAFVTVVQAGSFTAAAELLGSDKARLSRTVSALETELGTRLLARSTRALRLTDSGRPVYERALGILQASDELLGYAKSLQDEPQGRLRLTCPSDFALVAANQWIASYLQRWPRVTVDADFTSRRVDLVYEGFDLALRVGELEDSSLAARRLGELNYGLFASPAYLARQPAPADLDALVQHPLLMFATGSGQTGWWLRPADGTGSEQRFDAAARVRCGSSTLLLEACAAGLGIARLPLALAAPARAAGRLLPVLPGWQPRPVPVHAVFPSRRLLAPPVRAFIEHAVAAMASSPLA